MPISTSRSLIRSGLIGLALLLAAPSSAGARAGTSAPVAPVLVDRFTGKAVDQSLWTASNYGTGPVLAVRHGRLVVNMPADSAPPPDDREFGVGLVSRCTAAADFDVQVDYSLLTWPAANGVRLGLRLIPAGGGPLSPGGQVERTSFGSTDYTGSPREVYLTFFAGETDGITAADGTSGKLRMVRAGDTMTGYYWSDGQWVLIHSGPGPTGAVSFGLAAWSFSGPFAQHRVRAAFDNFVVNQGQLDCAQVFLQRKQGSYLFSPRRAEVTVGTRVIWENGTATPDRIVSDTRGWKFDKKLRRGASVSFVFSRPGTYQYHSKAHPGMKARVVVAPAPSGSSAPEGGAL